MILLMLQGLIVFVDLTDLDQTWCQHAFRELGLTSCQSGVKFYDKGVMFCIQCLTGCRKRTQSFACSATH